MTENLKEMMQAIADRCPNKRIPDDYLVIDLETTGFPNAEREEYVTQFGYAVVQGRKIIDNESTLLKTPPGWISEGASQVTGITDEMIQRDGSDPKPFYMELIKLFELYRKNGCMFVGHNVVGFDAPFLEADFEHHGIDFKFDSNEFIDTGMMFKASQIFAAPADGERLGEFFRRIREVHSRKKWNLAFAIRQLGLDMTYGINLDEAHDAGFDCKITHLLLEDLRQRAEAL